jgi:hypothetical protein
MVILHGNPPTTLQTTLSRTVFRNNLFLRKRQFADEIEFPLGGNDFRAKTSSTKQNSARLETGRS